MLPTSAVKHAGSSLGGWHLGTVPRAPRPQRGPALWQVIAATDDGLMISLNNFHRQLGMNYCHNLNSI